MSSRATTATRPMPQRRVARAATTAPTNEDAPPTPATRPRTAGLSCSSSRTNRNQVAPKIPHRPASAISAPANARSTGSWTTSRTPSRISWRTGSRSSAGGGAASGRRMLPSSAAETRNDSGVDGDGDRRGQRLDEEPAHAEREELRGRPARRERAVGLDEPFALDDRRQVRAVGGIEECRQDRGQPRDDQELPVGQGAERERDRDRAEQQRSTEVGPDEDRTPPEPVDPGARDEPDDERRGEVEPAQDRDLDRARAEDEDRGERQRDARDERPEDRYGRGAPHPHEGGVRPDPGRERTTHEGGA